MKEIYQFEMVTRVGLSEGSLGELVVMVFWLETVTRLCLSEGLLGELVVIW